MELMKSGKGKGNRHTVCLTAVICFLSFTYNRSPIHIVISSLYPSSGINFTYPQGVSAKSVSSKGSRPDTVSLDSMDETSSMDSVFPLLAHEEKRGTSEVCTLRSFRTTSLSQCHALPHHHQSSTPLIFYHPWRHRDCSIHQQTTGFW